MTTGYSGPDLYHTLSQTVGYLNQAGYNGHVFPIIMTETGSALQDPGDTDFYNSLNAYLHDTGDAADGQHQAIDSAFWWYASSFVVYCNI